MEKKHRRFRVVLPIAAVVVLLVAGVFYYIAGIQRSLWNQTVAEILEVTSQGNHAFEIYVNKDMQILNRIVKHLSVLDAGDEALITREIDSFEDGEVYFTVIVPDRSLMYSRGGQGARQIEEEERRMFYVGMTRAKKRLHIFYVKERYHKRMEVSRFLEEAGLIQERESSS
mgnify:CR=1 FL=1